jgi:hypothetical protein
VFRPLRIALHLAVIAALFVETGGHWLVLQSVAWTGMLLEYSQESSFGTAMQKTFDGEHPCDLCKTIQGAGKQTLPGGLALVAPDIKGVLSECLVLEPPPVRSFVYSSLDRRAEVVCGAPTSPPPRRGC